jgi:hypothetical protein
MTRCVGNTNVTFDGNFRPPIRISRTAELGYPATHPTPTPEPPQITPQHPSPTLFLISIHSPRIPAASFTQMKDFTGVIHCLSSVDDNPNLIAKPPRAGPRLAIG